MTIYLSVSESQKALMDRFVEVLDALGHTALETDGRFICSLAGGETPRDFYTHWAKTSQLDWSRVILFFGDERCVPPDDPESNYRMLNESLMDNLETPPQLYRMQGEHPDPKQAAREYDAQIKEVLGSQGRLHVSLMGLGDDGHTASLYPGMPTLREGDQYCASTVTPDHAQRRLTLTVPLLRQTHKVMFLATGKHKADIVARVMEGRFDPEQLPAQFFLRDDRLNVNLLLDEGSASKLQKRD